MADEIQRKLWALQRRRVQIKKQLQHVREQVGSLINRLEEMGETIAEISAMRGR